MSTEDPHVTELAKREPTIMEIIREMAMSPNARDQVEVMKEMIAMKERVEDRAALQAFGQALHNLQSALHPIVKDTEIVVKGKVRSRFASFESIDDVVRPLMDQHGFAFQMSETAIEGNMRVFVGTLIHEQGHEKPLMVRLPLDKSEFRSEVQSEAATISYARRQLYKLHFNIVEYDEENPALVEPISEEELKDLNTKIIDTKANLKAFCGYFNVASLKDLKKADLSAAHEMLDQKAARQKDVAAKEAKQAEQRATGQL